jgi:cytochrome P450
LPHFNQQSIHLLSEALQQYADSLMQDIRSTNQQVVDIQESLVFPLAVRAICVLMGIPPLEVDWLKRRTRAIVDFLDLGYTEPAYLPCHVALEEMQARMHQIIEDRQIRSGSWLDSLVTASEKSASGLEQSSIIALLLQVLFAGQETIGDTIGNAIHRFVMEPAQLAILYQQPALVDNAVEEILRYENPVNFLGTRVLNEDIQLNDVHLEANAATIVVLWACNRDGRRFINPDQFDIQRNLAGSQLSFGHGLHTCIGTHLARLLIRIVLNTLTKQLSQPWQLADAVVWRENMIFSGPLSLKLKLEFKD